MNANVKTTRANEDSLFRTIFLIAGLGTLVVATNYLDPINLPKLVAILVPFPWLALYLWRSLGKVTLVSQLLTDRFRLIFIFPIISILILAITSPTSIERRFLGTWGRNNGLFTLLVSVLIAWGSYELLKSNFNALKFLRTTTLILAPTAAYGIIQVFGKDPIAWSSGSMKIFATFGNTNFASAAWGLGAIISLALFLFDNAVRGNANSVKMRASYLVSFFLFSFLSYKTKSIQGLFAISAYVALTLILFLLAKKNIASRVSALIIFLSGGLVAQSIFFNGPLTNLISSAGSLGFRKIYWNIGWDMFISHPIFGAGVDSFGDFYRNVRNSQMATTTSIDLVVNNAHNSFIQALATLGIFGFLIVLLPVIFTLSFGLYRQFKESSFSLNSNFLAIFVALWLMAAFSIDNISITLWNWIFLGAALGASRQTRFANLNEESKKSRKNSSNRNQLYDFGKVVATILSVFVFFLAWTSASADRKLVSVFRTPASFSQPETINARLLALGEISRMRALDPQHYLTIARALVELQQVPQSIDVLSKGVAEYPRDFALWDSLAYSLEQQGRIPEAITAREKQVELDPRHARIWSYLAQDYVKNNEIAKAKLAASKSLSNLSIFAPEDQQKIRNFLDQLKITS
jgi:O-antigen ligase